MRNLKQFKSVRRSDGPSLAAVAICRNELVDIKRFITHMAGWIDEIVVVDDGSTDGTLEYLESCGAHVTVVHRRLEPEGGFAAQRNAGIASATAEWLIHMDIDERITPELALEVRSSIRDTHMNAFRYRRLNYFLHRPFMAGGWQHWNAPQLARRGAHHFARPIHEHVEVEGGAAAVGQLNAPMVHLNDDSFAERLRKNAAYSESTAAGIVATGRRVGLRELGLVPLKRALNAYIRQGAYRHGVPGLIFAVHTFSGTFNWYACAWDQQNRVSRDELERQLETSWAALDKIA